MYITYTYIYILGSGCSAKMPRTDCDSAHADICTDSFMANSSL